MTFRSTIKYKQFMDFSNDLINNPNTCSNPPELNVDAFEQNGIIEPICVYTYSQTLDNIIVIYSEYSNYRFK